MAWKAPPSLVTGLRDIRVALTALAAARPQHWLDPGCAALDDLVATLDRAAPKLAKHAKTSSAPFLRHLLSEGTLYDLLPRTLHALVLGGPITHHASPAPAAAASPSSVGAAPQQLTAGNAMASVLLTQAQQALVELVSDVALQALSSSTGTAAAEVQRALAALHAAGLRPALCAVMALVSPHTAQLQTAAARDSLARSVGHEPPRLVDHAILSAAALANQEALTALQISGTAAYTAAWLLRLSMPAGSDADSAAEASQLLQCLSEGAAAVLLWLPAGVGTTDTPTWADAAVLLVKTAAMVFQLSHPEETDQLPPPLPSAAAAQLAPWSVVSSGDGFGRMLLAMLRCYAAAAPAAWCVPDELSGVAEVLQIWVLDRLNRDPVWQVPPLVAALAVAPAHITALARLALRLLEDRAGQHLAVMLVLLLPHVPGGDGGSGGGAEMWDSVAAFSQGVLQLEPGASRPGPLPWKEILLDRACEAMVMLEDFWRFRSSAPSAANTTAWFLQGGLLSRYEAWLRAPGLDWGPTKRPLVLFNTAAVAVPLLQRLLSHALTDAPGGDGRRAAPDVAAVAQCLSLVATLRKFGAGLLAAAGPVRGGDSVCNVMFKILAAFPLGSLTAEACPAAHAVLRIVALQLMHPTVVRAAARPPPPRDMDGECLRGVGLLSLMHRCGLADVTAAAGSPVQLQALLEGVATRRDLSGRSACLGLAEAALLALQTAGNQPGWLSFPGLLEAVGSAVDAAGADSTLMAGGDAGARVRLAQKALSVLERQRQGLRLSVNSADPTWDSCLLATENTAAGEEATAGMQPFFGCWHHSCTNLGNSSEAALKLLKCSQCKRARYCSPTCQKAAWMKGHRAACKAWMQDQGSPLSAPGVAVAAAVQPVTDTGRPT